MPLTVKKIGVSFPSYGNEVDGDLLFNVDAEAWAVGTRNGVAVTSGDPTFQNNAKYFVDTKLNLPTTAGNYILKVTVSGGKPSYSWISAT